MWIAKPLFEAPRSNSRIFLSFFFFGNTIEPMQQGNELHDLATFFLNTFLVEILIDVWANTTFLKKKTKTLWLLFMDGVQLPQG